MNAAQEIDNYALQQKSQGHIVLAIFTHGTSQQRMLKTGAV